MFQALNEENNMVEIMPDPLGYWLDSHEYQIRAEIKNDKILDAQNKKGEDAIITKCISESRSNYTVPLIIELSHNGFVNLIKRRLKDIGEAI